MPRLLLISLLSLVLQSLPLRADEKPNVLLIVADDLGYSDLGCYGGEIETPHLDGLAEEGLRLTRFYTTGRCCPSRASILTGLYPHLAGLGHMVKDLGQPGYTDHVSENAVTMAQALQGEGYRSFISGKWHLGTDDPTRHGFEEFYGTLVSAKTFWDPDHYLRLPEGLPKRQYPEGEFYGTDAITDHALDFLGLARETPDQPWFLYLAYNAPHFLLQAPVEDIANYAERYQVGWDVIREERHARQMALGVLPEGTPLSPRSEYVDWGEDDTGVNPAWDTLPSDRRDDLARRMAIFAAMVGRMDQNIGRILEDLRNEGELENTLIVFVSDNGACAEWDPWGFDIRSGRDNILHWDERLEEMGGPGTFHSAGSGWANASNTPWRLYKHYTHEGGIASPCIIRWPAGQKGAGRMDSTPAHLIDLMPTVLEAAGAAYPDSHEDRMVLPMSGVSLLPLIQGAEVENRPLFFEHEGNRAMISGPWKLVGLKGKSWELYDTRTDRVELHDVSAEHPEIIGELERQWDAWAEENQVTPLPEDYGVEYVRGR